MNVYVMADEKVVVHQSQILLQDIADVFCNATKMQNKLRTLPVCQELTKRESQQVVDLYKLLCDWMKDNPEVSVQFIGATKVLVEFEVEKRGLAETLWTALKIVFACCICFFGATFTIMAFHNDIGIGGVFEKIYQLFMGRHPSGLYVLEISYSVGLALGIVLFFNHLGGKRISKDPTPVEVAMESYEQGVNQTIIAQDKSRE